MKRFLANDFREVYGKDFDLSGSEHHHLAVVTRSRVGDVVTTGHKEFDYVYRIVAINKNATRLAFVQKRPNTANPKAHLTVFLPIIKPDCMALAIQKLNELGASEILIYRSANSNIARCNIEKLGAIAAQSCKQCGRSIPIRIYNISFDVKHLNPEHYDVLFFADESLASGTLDASLSKLRFTQRANVALIVGPEGGFTPHEREVLRSFKRVVPVSLGSRILRTETAVIAASAILLSKMGEI